MESGGGGSLLRDTSSTPSSRRPSTCCPLMHAAYVHGPHIAPLCVHFAAGSGCTRQQPYTWTGRVWVVGGALIASCGRVKRPLRLPIATPHSRCTRHALPSAHARACVCVARTASHCVCSYVYQGPARVAVESERYSVLHSILPGSSLLWCTPHTCTGHTSLLCVCTAGSDPRPRPLLGGRGPRRVWCKLIVV